MGIAPIPPQQQSQPQQELQQPQQISNTFPTQQFSSNVSIQQSSEVENKLILSDE